MGQTYNRPFDSGDLFALQDELVPRIVSTVADAYGILPRTMSQAVRRTASTHLTPYRALLRSFSYAERVTADEHAAARAALERAVQQAPGSSDCWAMLSIVLTDEHIHGFPGAPDPLGRALDAARRAVDSGATNHKAHQALAWALFFRREFQASRIAAERTLALNPMDACAAVYMGQTIAFAGSRDEDWRRGCEIITRAIGLNPNHPGWYWYALFVDGYRQRDYRAALDIAFRMNMPGFHLWYSGAGGGTWAARRAGARPPGGGGPTFGQTGLCRDGAIGVAEDLGAGARRSPDRGPSPRRSRRRGRGARGEERPRGRWHAPIVSRDAAR